MQFMKVQIFKHGICNAIFQIKDDLNRNVKAIQNDLKSLNANFFGVYWNSNFNTLY